MKLIQYNKYQNNRMKCFKQQQGFMISTGSLWRMYLRKNN